MASRDVSGEWFIRQKGLNNPIYLSLVQLRDTLTGTARYSNFQDTVEWGVIHGTQENVVSSTALHGTVNDSAIVLEIAWTNGTKGRYSGSFQPDGRLSGITVDVNSPGSQATWVTERAFLSTWTDPRPVKKLGKRRSR
jgi:hypothetical protein